MGFEVMFSKDFRARCERVRGPIEVIERVIRAFGVAEDNA